jgi:hypothetical protein
MPKAAIKVQVFWDMPCHCNYNILEDYVTFTFRAEQSKEKFCLGLPDLEGEGSVIV